MSIQSKVEVLAVTPARSGSKSVRDKNIRLLAGKPLLAHSIEHALASGKITRTIVSTDSARYAEIARSLGAEVPFLRPKCISGDDSTDLETFTHALRWLDELEDYRPDLVVHLRPTHPVRRVRDIDRMIQMLMDHPEADSIRSVAPAPETPFKMWFLDEHGYLQSVTQSAIHDPWNEPRQRLPEAYLQNASIDVTRASTILEKRSMTGDRILGYVMDYSFDIDTEEQLREAEQFLTKNGFAEQLHSQHHINGKKTYVFDIDGVIAGLTSDLQYDTAGPIVDNISVLNALYDLGHRIVLFTARGSETGIDWSEVTERQMKKWGVKYHELRFGKPAADYYIDDRFIDIEQLRRAIAEQESTHD